MAAAHDKGYDILRVLQAIEWLATNKAITVLTEDVKGTTGTAEMLLRIARLAVELRRDRPADGPSPDRERNGAEEVQRLLRVLSEPESGTDVAPGVVQE
jgi:hypothetical protein